MAAATFLPRGEAQALSESWYGHALSAFSPVRAAHESSFTRHGKSCQGTINDFSSAGRSWIDVCVSSPSPSTTILSQHIGVTSVTNALSGPINFTVAVAESRRAKALGDTAGLSYSLTDTVASVAQTGFGVDYAVFRTANIASLVNPSDASKWETLSRTTGLVGNILGGVMYTGAALNEARKGRDSFTFKERLEFHKQCPWGVRKDLDKNRSKTDQEKIAYLQKGLRATEEDLIESEERHIWKGDFTLFAAGERLRKMAEENIARQAEALAVKEQTGILKERIEAMRKHHIGKPGFAPTSQELEKIVRQRLGIQGLQEHGKKLLLDNLKAKKITKMTRRIGEEGVQELQKAPERIVLANIKVSHSKTRWGYVGRAALYTLGAVGMILACICTGGTAAFILSVVLAGVFLREANMSYKNMLKMRQDGTSPPGAYDRAWPIGSMILGTLAITSAVILTSVLSLGVVPLVYVIGAGLLWIGTNAFQLSSLNEKRKRHVEWLLKKEHLSLEEFAYLLKYTSCQEMGVALQKADPNYEPREDTALQKVFGKLSYEDREAMLACMHLPYDFVPEDAKKMHLRCQIATRSLFLNRETEMLKSMAAEIEEQLTH